MPRTGLSQHELKEKILEAVEANVRKYGLERTRLVDVAKTLGLSHSVLYKLFPDKQGLFDAVSERWLLYIEAELQKVTNHKAKASTKLRQWFITLHQLKLKKVQSDPELYATFNAAASSRRQFVQRHLRTNREMLEAMVEEGIKSGEFKAGNAQQIAQTLFYATLAFHHPKLVLEYLNQDRLAEFNAVLDVLLAGLRV